MQDITIKLAQRLHTLRQERGHSLDQLANLSGVSRAALSRLEKAEVSPTAETLGKLCTAYDLPLSRLMMQVESEFTPLIRSQDQNIWQDPNTGFRRRQISPPAPTLTGEVISAELQANASITYDAPPRAGLEHHLILQKGQLSLVIGEENYALSAGDCLRYHLNGASRFIAGTEGATYLLVLI